MLLFGAAADDARGSTLDEVEGAVRAGGRKLRLVAASPLLRDPAYRASQAATNGS